MSDKAHALLSASGAERWMACTPSARLEEPLPDTTSENAAKGTLAHAIAELKLRKHFIEPMGDRKYKNALKKLQDSPLYEEEMLRHTDEYVDYVESVIHGFSAPPYIAIEKRLDYSAWAPEGFGTGDCIIIGGDQLHIIDYKNGHKKVGVEDNSQMKLYALGAYKTYGILYPITKAKLTIMQPKADGAIEWDISIENLLSWGEWLKPIAQKAFKGEGEYISGDHCRYCRAKYVCRFRADSNMSIEPEKGKMPPLISNAEVGALLEKAKDLAAWVKDLEEYALSECLAGNEVPGWKAVEGRSIRQWSDSDAAFKTLVNAGTEEAILYERKPLSLAAVEKLLGKKVFTETVGGFITIPPGKPALVPATDNREAITNKVTPREAFGGNE